MKKTAILLFTILLWVSTGATLLAQSPEKLFKKEIEPGKAKDIRTDIRFFAGELEVNTSTHQLAECLYGYQDGFLRPEMTYSEVGKLGYLSIKSEEKGINLNKDHNKWTISLNKNIDNQISINLKAGEANIDLQNSQLKKFDYRMTAGESNIDLRNTSVSQVRFNLLAGEAHIDLSGKWENDCMAEIKGGVGEISVKVPYRTGVKIIISGVLGDVNIPFFSKDGDAYTNDYFGKTKNTIFLYISGGIGEINVEMVE